MVAFFYFVFHVMRLIWWLQSMNCVCSKLNLLPLFIIFEVLLGIFNGLIFHVKVNRHRYLQGDKDKKIEELKMELEHQEQLCAAYREKLFNFISKVEEQTEELSSKIQVIISNLRQVESGMHKHYPCRQ